MQIKRDPPESTNWTGSDATRSAVEVIPESEADLVAIVRGTEQEFPSPVRAVGHLHSTNACISTNVLGATARRGTLVRMEKFARLEPFTVEGSDVVYLRAGAGASLIAIRDALRTPWNCELAVSPEIGNATIGSSPAAGPRTRR
jgi:FAD/FMN-containing dehydrogenase